MILDLVRIRDYKESSVNNLIKRIDKLSNKLIYVISGRYLNEYQFKEVSNRTGIHLLKFSGDHPVELVNKTISTVDEHIDKNIKLIVSGNYPDVIQVLCALVDINPVKYNKIVFLDVVDTKPIIHKYPIADIFSGFNTALNIISNIKD